MLQGRGMNNVALRTNRQTRWARTAGEGSPMVPVPDVVIADDEAPDTVGRGVALSYTLAPYGMLVVDGAGSVLTKSPDAARRIASHPAISIDGGVLHCATLERQRALALALQSACAPGPYQGRGAPRVVPLGSVAGGPDLCAVVASSRMAEGFADVVLLRSLRMCAWARKADASTPRYERKD
jgi:hypothetical protein